MPVAHESRDPYIRDVWGMPRLDSLRACEASDPAGHYTAAGLGLASRQKQHPLDLMNDLTQFPFTFVRGSPTDAAGPQRHDGPSGDLPLSVLLRSL